MTTTHNWQPFTDEDGDTILIDISKVAAIWEASKLDDGRSKVALALGNDFTIFVVGTLAEVVHQCGIARTTSKTKDKK